MTDRELLKEAKDLIVMCSLLDKSNQCNEMADKIDKQLSIPLVSNRYFVFSGQEDGKATKYLVDDCKDRETAIAKIETEYPNFKWVMTETFNGC